MEFEWKIFPGHTAACILKEIQKTMDELQCEPADFPGRIIIMSMFNDIKWEAKGNNELCVNNSKTKKEYAERFPRGHWSFLGPGSEKKWYGTYDGIPSGYWSRTAEKLLLNFAGSGHPIFRSTSALERGKLRSKGRRKTTIHFTLLKMVMSVNQFRLYGAVAHLIKELPEDQKAPGRLVAADPTEQEILCQPPIAEVPSNDERQGNLVQDYERRSGKLSEDQKLSKLCSEAGLKFVEVGQFFFTLPSPRGEANQSLCREYRLPQDKEGTRIKGWIQSNVRFGPVWDKKSLQSQRRIQY